MATPAIKIKSGNITKNFTIAEMLVNQTATFTFTGKQWQKVMLQAEMLQEFRTWYGHSMKVGSWIRSKTYNKKCGGIATSNHLNGTATDIYIKGLKKSQFIKYAKKWREICNEHDVVGEAGIYSWGMHLGSQITYSKSFYHWDSRSGKQINNPFDELR